jgi:hypothetical protein
MSLNEGKRKMQKPVDYIYQVKSPLTDNKIFDDSEEVFISNIYKWILAGTLAPELAKFMVGALSRIVSTSKRVTGMDTITLLEYLESRLPDIEKVFSDWDNLSYTDIVNKVLGKGAAGFKKKDNGISVPLGVREQILVPMSNQTQCEAAVGPYGDNTRCWICNYKLFNYTGNDSCPKHHIDCEHILPIKEALQYFNLVAGSKKLYVMSEYEYKELVRLIYAWAHKCCNMMKLDDVYIYADYTTGMFNVNPLAIYITLAKISLDVGGYPIDIDKIRELFPGVQNIEIYVNNSFNSRNYVKNDKNITRTDPTGYGCICISHDSDRTKVGNIILSEENRKRMESIVQGVVNGINPQITHIHGRLNHKYPSKESTKKNPITMPVALQVYQNFVKARFFSRIMQSNLIKAIETAATPMGNPTRAMEYPLKATKTFDKAKNTSATKRKKEKKENEEARKNREEATKKREEAMREANKNIQKNVEAMGNVVKAMENAAGKLYMKNPVRMRGLVIGQVTKAPRSEGGNLLSVSKKCKKIYNNKKQKGGEFTKEAIDAIDNNDLFYILLKYFEDEDYIYLLFIIILNNIDYKDFDILVDKLIEIQENYDNSNIINIFREVIYLVIKPLPNSVPNLDIDILYIFITYSFIDLEIYSRQQRAIFKEMRFDPGEYPFEELYPNILISVPQEIVAKARTIAEELTAATEAVAAAQQLQPPEASVQQLQRLVTEAEKAAEKALLANKEVESAEVTAEAAKIAVHALIAAEAAEIESLYAAQEKARTAEEKLVRLGVQPPAEAALGQLLPPPPPAAAEAALGQQLLLPPTPEEEAEDSSPRGMQGIWGDLSPRPGPRSTGKGGNKRLTRKRHTFRKKKYVVKGKKKNTIRMKKV